MNCAKIYPWSDLKRNKGLLVVSIDFRGRERNVRQAWGPSAAARLVRRPIAAVRKAISLHLKSVPKIYAHYQEKERDRK